MSDSWTVRERRLLLDWTPAGGEVLRAVVTVKAQPHTSENDLLCLGREDIGEHCNAPIMYRLKAYACELAANRAETAEKVELLNFKRLGKLNDYKVALDAARRNAGIAATGTGGQTQRTWP